MPVKKQKYSHQQMQIILSMVTAVIIEYDKVLKNMYGSYVNCINQQERNNADIEIMETKKDMMVFNDIKIVLMKKMIEPKEKYNFKLKPYQELAFFLEFMQNNNLQNDSDIMIQDICNNIHKKYAQHI